MRRFIEQRVRAYWRSSTARAVGSLAGSSILATVLGVVGAFVQGWFVSPADLGYFRQFSIVSGYLFMLHLGVFHALERYYPYYIGRGETHKAIAMVEVGRAWILAVCGSLCAVFLVLSGVGFLQGDWRWALGWLSQAILIVCTLYGGYLSAIYRSGHDFEKYAKAQMWGIPASLLMLPVFWLDAYVGLFFRTVAGSGVTLWRLHRNRPVKVVWRFTWREWWATVKQGLPRFSASYAATTGLDTVTATIILQRFGGEALGFWSFAGMLVVMSQQVPQALTAVYVPRVAELYGRTGSPSQCLALCRKPVFYGLGIIAVFVIGTGLATYLLLPLILPKYARATGLVCLLLLSLPLKMLEAPASVLGAMNWLVFLNVRAVAGSLLQIGCIFAGIYLGWGLYGAATGVLAGGVVRVLMLWAALVHACRLERKGVVA